MRVSLALCIAAVIFACDSPTTPRTLQVPTDLRPAVITQEHGEVLSFAINDCNGEPVLTDVKFHDVFAVTPDGSGGIHFKLHENVQGSAVNATTGATYNIMQVVDIELSDAGAVEYSVVLHFNLQGKAQTPNEVLQSNLHLTVTPNGDVSSFHDHFVLQCQA